MVSAPDVLGRLRAAHVDQIVSRGERPAGAGEHERPQVVQQEHVEGRMDLAEHPEREGIQLFGAVQNDRGDPPVAAAENLLVGHERLILPSVTMWPRAYGRTGVRAYGRGAS